MVIANKEWKHLMHCKLSMASGDLSASGWVLRNLRESYYKGEPLVYFSLTGWNLEPITSATVVMLSLFPWQLGGSTYFCLCPLRPSHNSIIAWKSGYLVSSIVSVAPGRQGKLSEPLFKLKEEMLMSLAHEDHWSRNSTHLGQVNVIIHLSRCMAGT